MHLPVTNGWPHRLTASLGAVLLGLTTVVVASTSAGAAETVTDGGFETSTDDYSNPHWTTSGDNVYFAVSFGHTGSRSAALDNFFPDLPAPALEQTITIPAASSARLGYWRLFAGTAQEPLEVSIDGVAVDTVGNDQEPGWVQESVNVSDFADGSSHVLRFERTTEGAAGHEGGTEQSVFIDDVSVFATPHVAAVVELTYKPTRKLFRGTVHADQGCAADRAVVVKRVRRGVDRAVGKATTAAEGGFKVRKDAKPGRYYAVVRATQRPDVMCLADTSLRVKVD